jgi:8-amino-7-oxononanoate synthase
MRMETALGWWRQLVESGVYVNMVLPPATPTGNCLLRCSLSAAHSDQQVTQLLEAYLGLPNHEQGIAA